MKTIGTLLRMSREQQGITLRELSRRTKIREEFLASLEAQNWNELPELPVVVGFVKSVSDELSINRDQAVAFLRRDYPPRNLSINPKPDLKKEVRLGPRFLTGVLVLLVMIVLGGYLVYQYNAFTKPPELSLISPAQGELVTSSKLNVIGTTAPNATIRINGQPVLVGDDGNFAAEIDMAPEIKEIQVKAISRSGKETTITRTIDVQLPKK